MKQVTVRDKKLSYRRDNAKRWSLRHSKAFKVIDLGNNRKPVQWGVCDFPLENNTNLHPISYRLRDIVQY